MKNNLLCEWFKAIIFLSYLWINSILTQMLLGSWTRKTSCLVTLFNTSSKICKLTLSEGSIINEILLEIFQTFNACIASPLAHSSLPHRHLFRHYFKSKENVLLGSEKLETFGTRWEKWQNVICKAWIRCMVLRFLSG